MVTSRNTKMRVYLQEDSCVFKKNNEAFGELSNMATIFPLKVNGYEVKTSEALYQSCKYPFYPDIQREICLVKSPMTAKMIGRSHSKKIREDWEDVKVRIMRWCLRIKLAQHFITFGGSLAGTKDKSIVENSSKDNFWGAIPNNSNTEFVGINALGRLLMELREDLYTNSLNSLLVVRPPHIQNFYLFGEKINVQDERDDFVTNFLSYLNGRRKKSNDIGLNIFGGFIIDMVHGANELSKHEGKGSKPHKRKTTKMSVMTLF